LKDSKIRFSDRVENYKKYRPTYPIEAIEFIKDKCNIGRDCSIADIGSGTGISSASLIKVFQCNVFAVEPNEKMRAEAETLLSDNPLFHSINGSSENTSLDENSIQIITAFQSFHWFNKELSKLEFRRIAAEPKWIVFVWNDRKVDGTSFLKGYNDVLKSLPEYHKVNHKNLNSNEIEQFIETSNLMYNEYDNVQKLDYEGLIGRFFSSSYTPKTGTNEYQICRDKLMKLFKETNQNGFVELGYTTKIYMGKMK
jgi:SAM-dependent methyltransferase